MHREDLEGKIRHLAINDWGSVDALDDILYRLWGLQSVTVGLIPQLCTCDSDHWDGRNHFPFAEWELNAQSRGLTFKDPIITLVQWAEFEAQFN